MQKIVRLLSIIFITLLSITFFNAVYISDVPSEKNTADSYTIKALKIPDELTFAGEKVPTELYDIKERMDRELLVNTYWQSNGLLLIKRAHKYFPIIEPMLKKYGIPVPDGKIITSISEALMAAEKIHYPITLKVSDVELAHKTELGAVVLNINNPLALEKACQDLFKIGSSLLLKKWWKIQLLN